MKPSRPAGRLLALALALSCLVTFSACGGRVPEPESAQKIVSKYFKKYGKKYRWSDFGQYRLAKVEIGEVREIQKGMVEIEAFTYLAEGAPTHHVRLQARKKTLGWKGIGWENLGTR